MQEVALKTYGTGLSSLDELLQGLRLGDNVVWNVDFLEDYPYFAEAFASQAKRDGRDCVYIRFAPHPPVLNSLSEVTVKYVDPAKGFDCFSTEIHWIIERYGQGKCFIFDNISSLVNKWATDELLANFFQITCPYLFELNDLAYFALRRGQHGHNTVNRIRNTTQILLDVYRVAGNVYVHPIKVWKRYSTHMFLPHLFRGETLEAVSHSSDAATILSAATQQPTEVRTGSNAPWDVVYHSLKQYQEKATEDHDESKEAEKLKEALSRMIFGNHPNLNRLADRYLTLNDLLQVRGRLVGSGRIGGKAAGMLIARRVLVVDKGVADFTTVLEEHDSFYIGSDVFFTFLVSNNLFRARLEISEEGKISRADFTKLEARFLSGHFSEDIMEQFRNIIDYYGQASIIIRSSSLLEDGFTDAFAGKYRSEFCVNQGSPEDRLEAFLRAVKLVYASSLNPDALAYRHKRGFSEGEEQMAVLVQRVSGIPYEHYFFPMLAGVAFSRNLYAWTDRIDPGKGMIRLVFGLGTRAVNRVSKDYPRMIAISHPQLRPEIGMEVAKYSQRMVDVLNLETNTLEIKPFLEIIHGNTYPTLHLLTSEIMDGYVRDGITVVTSNSKNNLILTFNNLINKTQMVAIIGEILEKLERAWTQPIDIEFTAYVDSSGRLSINVLQCRSLRIQRASSMEVRLPKKLPAERILFRSNKAISAGVISDIRYIIYVDPEKYIERASVSEQKSLRYVIGKLNDRLPHKEGKVMAMGPGRWGSSNIALGVNVSYADINEIAVLVEVACEKAGNTPEVSYGTHFFQDLVESEILYLPIYPDDKAAEFNAKFFISSLNILKDIAPELSRFKDVVQVIDVKASSDGLTATVVADIQTRRAVCFLGNKE
jgi:pyruvate, water dikinase